ncbi:hypothetical protein TrST_g12797 [Triparma strigata]|uniref:G-protein coupled receptors family 3 profile domain-containing protein n=1 Tax=Triparma strigata TaxID=1606541 RepID=A0A9W7BA76_9STRA|nr:hypothetical protein TrST_g12797 [Triparma strigata]
MLDVLRLVGLLTALCASGADAAVTAGSSSGYAIRFQGGSDFAGFRESFKTLAASTYPSAALSEGVTVMAWLKPLMPLTTSKRMTIMGDAGSFKFTPMFDWSSGYSTASKHGTFGSFINLNNVGGEINYAHEDLYDTWHHWAMTITASGTADGTSDIKYYINGVEEFSDSTTKNKIDWADLDGFSLGSYSKHDETFVDLYYPVSDHWNGWMDELAVYKKTLTTTEIATAMNTKLTGSETDIIMAYDFDAYGATSAGFGVVDNLASADDALDLQLGSNWQGSMHMGPAQGTADATFGDKVCRDGYVSGSSSGAVVYCDPTNPPIIGPSGLPSSFANSGLDVVVTAKAGETITITLPGDDTTNVGATLTWSHNSDASSGTLDSLSAATVTYTAPSPFTAPATFTYQVESSVGPTTSSAATVRIIPAVAPVVEDLSFGMIEDKNASVILASYDGAGLKNEYTITSLPANGRLFQTDGSDNTMGEISTVPTTVDTSRFLFIPTKDQVAARTFKFKASNAHGLESAEKTVTISVTLSPDKPLPTGSETVMVPGLTEINLSAQVVDPDTAFYSVIIDELPVLGSLYYENDDTTSAITKYDPFAAPVPISQFAFKILETSTYWPSDVFDWDPTKALGPGDIDPQVYGDSKLGYCPYSRDGSSSDVCGYSIHTGDLHNFDPDGTVVRGTPGLATGDVGFPYPASECWNHMDHFASDGYTEFLTFQFDEEVYVSGIEIGVNRGMGCVVAVEAYDRTSGTWQPVWTGEADTALWDFHKATGQYHTFVPYPVCATHFKTDIIKIKLDTNTIKDWNEIDYIQLTGSTEQAGGVLNGGKVYYAPPADAAAATCIDNFAFSATDCGGQSPRKSASEIFAIKESAGSTLPNCVAKATQDVSALVTTFSPTDVSASYDGTYTYEAIADDWDTWTYSAADNLFTFDWTAVDSDKTKYDVSFDVKSGTTLVATQTVTMSIQSKYVYLAEDILFTKSDCTNSNKYEITYSFAADKTEAIGGRKLPPDTTENCAEVPYSSGAGTIITLLSVIGTIYCGLFAAFIIVKKKHPVIKSSQPAFCVIFAVGCSLVCLQIITFLGDASDGSCAARNWIFNCLFTLAFGSLFAKTWRVWRVFSNTHLKKIRLTNMDTMRVMFILLSGEVLILALGQTLAPYKAQEELVEFAPERFITTTICKSDTGEWHLLTMAWKVVLVIIGCYLSWTTRNVDNAFAESKYIMLAIYQIAIYGLVAAVVAGADTAIETTLLVQTICCVFGAVSCVSSVFAPKFMLIQSGQYDQGFKSASQGTSLNTGNGSGASQDEVEKLEVEIERLRGILEDNNLKDEI